MLASVFIIGVSVLLFIYWFRYTCLLILNTKSNEGYAEQIAGANQLSFLEARDALNAAKPDTLAKQSLDKVRSSLARDYALLTYLLRHAGYNVDSQSFEQRMIRADFQFMRVWYAFVRIFSLQHARGALLEMVSIVDHLASTMGERVASSQNS